MPNGVALEKRFCSDCGKLLYNYRAVKCKNCAKKGKYPSEETRGKISETLRHIPLTKEELFDLYINQRKGSSEIARLYNCNPSSIVSRLKRDGIPIRSRHERPKKVIPNCIVEGCNTKRCIKELCRKHYDKYYKKDINKEYYEKNKGRVKESAKRWAQENKEKRLIIEKRSREKRKGKIAEYNRIYYQNNKKWISERTKRWSQTPSGKASVQANVHKRRLLTQDLTKETVQLVYEHNILKYGRLTCILCNKPIKFGEESLEHLTPLSKGGTNDYDNLGITHNQYSEEKCNNKKFTKTLEEWQLTEKEKEN